MASKHMAAQAPSEAASTPDVPSDPQGLAALHAALETALRETARVLRLPLGMEGEVFTPPPDTHLRGKISIDTAAAASLGPNALTRADGTLEIIVAVQAGLGMSTAMSVAQAVLRALPRGRHMSFHGNGRLVLSGGSATPEGLHTDRSRVAVHIPFYALYQEV